MSLMDILDEVEGKALYGLIGKKMYKSLKTHLLKNMVRGPWLIIMDSRLKIRDKAILGRFSE